jgi:hypothetical protein
MLNDMQFQTRIQDDNDFLATCDLPDCDHVSHITPRLGGFNIDEKNPEAWSMGNTIVAITAGMSEYNKGIIKDSIQLASIAATNRFPQDGVERYGHFLRVLTTCGWFSQSSGMSDYQVRNRRFTMEQAALEVLKSAIAAAALPGPTSLLLLNVAKDAVAALQNDEAKRSLFDQHSKTYSGGTFTIASSAESADGEVVMAMGALDFSSSLNITNVLFWEWSNSTVRIKRAQNHLTLNQVQYERVRRTVEAKLTEYSNEAINELF